MQVGNEAERLQDFSHVETFDVGFEQDCFGVKQTDDVVDLAVKGQDAVAVGGAKKGEQLFGGILDVVGDEIDAGRHDLLDLEVGDADDFLEKLVFRDIDHAGLLGHLEEFAEFIGGKGGVIVAVGEGPTRRWTGRMTAASITAETGQRIRMRAETGRAISGAMRVLLRRPITFGKTSDM